MYQIGDRVVYGIHGVCKVVALEERVIDRKRIVYLVLESVVQEGARYLVPTQNETAMAKVQKLMTPEELDVLFQNAAGLDVIWISEENRRKQNYRELLSAADRTALLAMICAIYRHKEIQISAGKKVHQCDENFLRDAERLLAGEIGVILELDFSQAIAYLRNKIKG